MELVVGSQEYDFNELEKVFVLIVRKIWICFSAEIPAPGINLIVGLNCSVKIRALGYGAQGRGFNPWPGHTKDFKNDTWCLSA